MTRAFGVVVRLEQAPPQLEKRGPLDVRVVKRRAGVDVRHRALAVVYCVLAQCAAEGGACRRR
eukprot:scaffold3751_cov117-Isochrysis_galbana.AAC.10